MSFFDRRGLGRALLLTAMSAAVWLSGCSINTGTPDGTGGSNTGVNVHTHTWGEWTELTPASCGVSGVEIRTCTQDASHKDVRTTPPLTGTWCNATGGGVHTHTWGDWVITTPATCNAQGEETRTCTQDANHREVRTIPQLTGAECNPTTTEGGEHVHTWGEWTVTVQPTCEETGMEMRLCTQNPSHRELMGIPKLTGAACNPEGGNNNGGGNNTSGGSSEMVTIGGIKWMKKNLDVQTAGSWCYGESGQERVGYDDHHNEVFRTVSSSEVQANCERYGRLYTWEAAKTACLSIGKRLPSNQDWVDLMMALGGEAAQETMGRKLKSTSGWEENGNGTNETGFSALPGGARNTAGVFYGAGWRGWWWSGSALDEHNFGATLRLYAEVDAAGPDHYGEGWGASVRCVDN